jgi:hypothetical protein
LVIFFLEKKGEQAVIRDLELQQFQAAVFSNHINIGDKLGIAKALQERIPLLDGEPLVLPIKDAQAPPEIPRILLKSEDGRCSLNVAKSRFDFIYKPEGNDLSEALAQYLPLLKQVLTACMEALSPTINRLGFVVKLICTLEGSSNALMLHKFIRSGNFENTQQIQLNVLNRFRLGTIETNRWIKIHSLRNTSNSLDDKAMLLELDINTLPEKAESYNFDAVMSFFGEASDHYVNMTNELVSIIRKS